MNHLEDDDNAQIDWEMEDLKDDIKATARAIMLLINEDPKEALRQGEDLLGYLRALL